MTANWDIVPSEANVLKCALASRVVLWAFAWLVSALSPAFDSSADLAPVPRGSGSLDATVESALSMFTHWDSVFFVQVSLRGYVWDQFFAFLPGYPLTINALATAVPSSLLSPAPAAVVAGFLLSNGCFVLAALLLFRLGIQVTRDTALAFKAALLFTINPASIFCSALYSESAFAAASFGTLLLLQRGSYWRGALMMGVCSALRANGLTLLGFIWIRAASDNFRLIRQRKQQAGVYRLFSPGTLCSLIALNGTAFAQCLIATSPFLLHLRNGYTHFCANRKEPADWCQEDFPNVYAHVQSSYWGVGMFNYFTVQQLPNFVLAAPVLLLWAAAVIRYGRADPLRFVSGGLLRSKLAVESGFLSTGVALHVSHFFALVMISLPVMHVQVMTRLLVASPALYWYAADLFRHDDWRAKAVLTYFLSYIAIGYVLHCNFLPWT